VIGMGFNFQLVAGNPLLSGLGPPEGGSSRLNLGNALGAVAQIIAPLILTLLIPAGAVTVADRIPYMKVLFGVIGAVLLGIMVLTLLARNVDISASLQATASGPASTGPAVSLWSQPKILLGFLTIFLVLGAEAGLFSFFRNFLEDPAVARVSSRDSQRLFTVFFAVFAGGRLAGSWLQKRVKPASSLAFNALAALVLAGVVTVAKGPAAIVAVILLGFFVSIFFPTLYSLAIAGLGEQTAKASGLLTMGFLGCALLPVLQGKLADTMGLQRSFWVLAPPYLFALFYALKGHRLIR
jgi:FHS family L-fucose permease-like MFS transporter